MGVIQHLIAARPAHRHIAGHRRHRKPDHHNHRPDHHRRQQTVDHRQPEILNQRGKHKIHKARCKQPEHRAAHAPFLHGIDNRRDKRKRRTQKNRHLAAGQRLKQQRTDARAQQRHRRVQPCEQRHQHHCAEGHKQNLRPRHCGFKRLEHVSSSKNSVGKTGGIIPESLCLRIAWAT